MIKNRRELFSFHWACASLAGLAFLAGCAAVPVSSPKSTGWIKDEVADSYVFGYPLVLMDVAREDVVRLDRLISDISEAARTDAELARARFEMVDLGLLIEQLVASWDTRREKGDARMGYATMQQVALALFALAEDRMSPAFAEAYLALDEALAGPYLEAPCAALARRALEAAR